MWGWSTGANQCRYGKDSDANERAGCPPPPLPSLISSSSFGAPAAAGSPWVVYACTSGTSRCECVSEKCPGWGWSSSINQCEYLKTTDAFERAGCPVSAELTAEVQANALCSERTPRCLCVPERLGCYNWGWSTGTMRCTVGVATEPDERVACYSHEGMSAVAAEFANTGGTPALPQSPAGYASPFSTGNSLTGNGPEK